MSNGGKTYTFTLRKGLVYSNGPREGLGFRLHDGALDQARLGQEELLTENIAGGEAFDTGKASSISGIQTDDATGRSRSSSSPPTARS